MNVVKKFQEFQENKKKEDFGLPDCLLTIAPFLSPEKWEKLIRVANATQEEKEILIKARTRSK